MFAALIHNLGNVILNLLAVIGGAAAGAFLTGFGVQLTTKMFFRKKVPPLILKLTRLLGGVAFGLLVYLLVSGGGSGFGFGGWGSGGEGTNSTQTGKGTGATEPAGTGKEKVKPQPTATQPTRPPVLRVEMLGGKRYQPGSNRYYLVEGVDEPRTLDELSVGLEERRKDPRFQGIEIVIYRTGSLAETTPQVKELKDRAQKLGLSVKTTLIDQDAP